MKLSRRNLLKLAGAGAGAVAAGGVSLAGTKAYAATGKLRIAQAREYPSVCCFCSGGCGVIAQVVDGKLVHTEGDPDNPSNRGSNCSKGAAVQQTHDNPERVTNVLHRSPGSDRWEIRSWDWAIDRIARLVKDTRDRTFQHSADGVTVNRTEAIGSLGSSILNNEDLYLIAKMMRGLGATYIEHQARI